MDFSDEDYFKRCYGRTSILLCGMIMRTERWTKKFKANMESTLAPVWVMLPEFLWHYHTWATMKCILEPNRPLVALDKAIVALTRPTKAQIEICLTKPRIKEVEVTLIGPNETGYL